MCPRPSQYSGGRPGPVAGAVGSPQPGVLARGRAVVEVVFPLVLPAVWSKSGPAAPVPGAVPELLLYLARGNSR